ncbi:MAG TPA: sulfatase, partial [Planctomycetaceae bacterium]|nr:sulfatase [Planctomycetaceae bacterium]
GSPHNPYHTAPPEYQSMYEPQNIRLRPNVPKDQQAAAKKELAGYYAHCSALDDCVGDLLATLKETGVDHNTIVVFTSDHGDMLHSHGQIRKQKPWDESLRVPMLFRLNGAEHA